MFTYYKITQDGVRESDGQDYNWLVIENSSEMEKQKLLEKYQLPKDIFVGVEEPEEVSRIEKLSDTILANAWSVILIDLADDEGAIEERLGPVSFIMADDLLITHVSSNSLLIPHFLKEHGKDADCFEAVITYCAFMIYAHYILELKEIKKRIDALDKAARQTTENQELFNLADLERDVVYLDHTLQDQNATLDHFFEREEFRQKLSNEAIVYDVKLRQRHANKMILIYRDLLETIGGLFSDMMNNSLNHLMKYLDSAALVIAVPALIGGLWGINTGGLPWKDQGMGSWIVFGLAIVLAIITAVHLYRKDYTK